MSKLKVLEGKSEASFNCPTFRQLAKFRANNACALGDELADEQREGLAHAIVYPAKTKPTGALKNNRRRVATQMPCDGVIEITAKVAGNSILLVR